MPAVQIRAATAGDRDVILDYNVRLAVETEDKQLHLDVIRLGVEAALADPDRLQYWLAEFDGRVVGQAAISREWSDWRNGWFWWFQSVYVDQDHRGQGVFRAIFDQVREIARRDPQVIGLRLYVEERNEQAQETYRALGMVPGGYVVYEQIWPERFNSNHNRG